MMGRIRTWRRPLPVAPLAWTGFYVFFCCSTLAVAQLPDTCTELPELNVTRNGSTIIFHRARPASSSQVNETSCICYPVLRDEQDFENFTCDNATSSHRTCDALPADQDNSVEVDISEQISSGESSICHFSNCGKKNCSIYDVTKDIVSVTDPNITLVNLSTAFVSWRVHHPYGLQVGSFSVTWCTEDANCSSDTTCFENGPQSRDRNVTHTNTFIEELSPATSLRLRVSPLGFKGSSSFRCIEIPPGEPESIKALKVSLHGLDSLQVQWAQQASFNASLDDYEVRYCLNEDEERCPENKELFPGNCSSIVSEGGLKRSSYNILRLKPKSAVVVGVATTRRYPSGIVTTSKETVDCFKTPAPGIITGLRAQDITSRNARVLWMFRQDGYQELRPASYNVTWCVGTEQQCPSNVSASALCQDSSQATVKTSQPTTNMNSLPPWSVLLVTVRAIYANGSDEVFLGDPVSGCFKTLAEAPAKPEDLRVTTIETTSATIEWTEPRVKNGVLDGYIIKVCRRNEPVENKCTGAPTLHIMINDSSTTSYKLGRSRSVD
ncbi:protein sidekick-1-like isoform X2 [Rhipicephalus sanguineus]|uniref:protein sidekick-1-like isoform X2 n=1 Tax=Rhipicephalus sanguineus TaxID=34632 RepID=UPI0020C212C9|nr:protein sidekick-1-like isoform X2 [Rhipicephalus sanguineus]